MTKEVDSGPLHIFLHAYYSSATLLTGSYSMSYDQTGTVFRFPYLMCSSGRLYPSGRIAEENLCPLPAAAETKQAFKKIY